MKKKKKATSKRSTNVRSGRISRRPVSIVWQRFAIFGGVAALLVVILLPAHLAVRHAVEGAQIVKGMYNQATVTIPHITGGVRYNIYFKKISESTYSNAVRNVDPSISSYTISYLQKATTYQYKVSAVNTAGAEFWWSPEAKVTNTQSM